MKKISPQNKDTFNTIFNELYVPLVYFASNYLDGNRGSSEDIVQDVFVNLLQKKKEFDSVLAVKGYLYQSVKNSCLNHQKHIKVRQLYANEKKAVAEVEDFSLNKGGKEETFNQLKNAIEHLPNRCKEIFELTLQGLKNSEIAARMEISEETVKSQKKRGKKILSEYLKQVSLLIMIYLSL